MSNKDTSKEAYFKKNSKIDLFQKEEMLLFSYELLKSKKMFDISGTNSFRYEFFEEKKSFLIVFIDDISDKEFSGLKNFD